VTVDPSLHLLFLVTPCHAQGSVVPPQPLQVPFCSAVVQFKVHCTHVHTYLHAASCPSIPSPSWSHGPAHLAIRAEESARISAKLIDGPRVMDEPCWQSSPLLREVFLRSLPDLLN
jgi:hypothetical protein